MISTEAWRTHGQWGDVGTPYDAATVIPYVGAWDSYLVDLSEGLAALSGPVLSGHIWWSARMGVADRIRCDVRVNDTGEWQRDLTHRSLILRAKEWNDLPVPTLRIRVRMMTRMGDLLPVSEGHLRRLFILLSSRESMPWGASDGMPLEWSERT